MDKFMLTRDNKKLQNQITTTFAGRRNGDNIFTTINGEELQITPRYTIKNNTLSSSDGFVLYSNSAILFYADITEENDLINNLLNSSLAFSEFFTNAANIIGTVVGASVNPSVALIAVATDLNIDIAALKAVIDD